jgi:hypothetical protein
MLTGQNTHHVCKCILCQAALPTTQPTTVAPTPTLPPSSLPAQPPSLLCEMGLLAKERSLCSSSAGVSAFLRRLYCCCTGVLPVYHLWWAVRATSK